MNGVTGSWAVCQLSASTLMERVGVGGVYKVLFCSKHVNGYASLYVESRTHGRVHKIVCVRSISKKLVKKQPGYLIVNGTRSQSAVKINIVVLSWINYTFLVHTG